MALTPALYLIPVTISDAPVGSVLPPENLEICRQIQVFVVESARTARRFLRRCDPSFPLDGVEFFELNKHTGAEEIPGFLQPLREGRPVGVMSEAGCPAVADPGAAVVEIAQREGFRVVPLVGPSSILLSLMASGFNGQGFTFNGYLPVEPAARVRKIKDLERISASTGLTQIFIETPYRNSKMLQTLTASLHPDTLLCVALAITDPEHESIVTMPVAKWRKRHTELDRMPAIFLIHRKQ